MHAKLDHEKKIWWITVVVDRFHTNFYLFFDEVDVSEEETEKFKICPISETGCASLKVNEEIRKEKGQQLMSTKVFYLLFCFHIKKQRIFLHMKRLRLITPSTHSRGYIREAQQPQCGNSKPDLEAKPQDHSKCLSNNEWTHSKLY